MYKSTTHLSMFSKVFSLVVPLIIFTETASSQTTSGSITPFPTGPQCLADTYEMIRADQGWVVPTGTYIIRIKAWGAGGPGNNNPFAIPGFAAGAGGYAEGDFSVGSGQLIAPGDSLSVMVGESRRVSANWNYGFGSSAVSAASGGGLSGVFLGSNPITATDSARALVIAGGGGGNDDNSPKANNLSLTGGPGGDPSTAGGNIGSMAGIRGNIAAGPGSHSGGAGGGYEGGGHHKIDNPASTSTLGGRGGTSFVHSSATATYIESLGFGDIGAPNTSDAFYSSPVATNSDVNGYNLIGHGQVVIQYCTAPASPSLSMDKVADNAGPYTVGDVVLYTYTVTNDGDETIQGVTITDTHNGSDPAPVPTNETLIIDTAPTGDSTDSSTDGSWDILAPGDIITFTGTYTITQTDVDNL